MNENFSILNLYELTTEPDDIPVFYQDLNLVQIMDRVSAKWGRGVRKFYRRPAVSSEEEEYRRAIYRDIKKQSIYDTLIAFTENLKTSPPD